MSLCVPQTLGLTQIIFDYLNILKPPQIYFVNMTGNMNVTGKNAFIAGSIAAVLFKRVAATNDTRSGKAGRAPKANCCVSICTYDLESDKSCNLNARLSGLVNPRHD
jgi:hypothetical protein